MIVVTLLESTHAALRAAIHELDDVADAFEIRLDALSEDIEPATMRQLTTKTLIATCRREGEAGLWRQGEDERLMRLVQCHRAGFDLIDIEDDTPIDVPENRLIRSHHHHDATPPTSKLESVLNDLAAQGALAKSATRVRDLPDTLELLGLTRRMARNGRPAAIMGLGDYPRALAHLVGARAIYGGGRRNAPGQPAARELDATLAHWGRPRPARDLYLVIGNPIQHSLSPRMHNAAFKHLGIDASYASLELTTHRDLTRLLKAASDLQLKGLSITSPIKPTALRACDTLSPEAKAAQSVNTILIRDGVVEGHNTDGLGARRLIDEHLGPDARRILLVGAGGAARGLLSQLGPRRVTIAARSQMARTELANAFDAQHIDLNEAARDLASYDLLINATSVEDPLPLDGHTGALFDLRYRSQPTAWQRHAATHGNPIITGRQLLLAQGHLAFQYWTKRRAPIDIMAKALEADA